MLREKNECIAARAFAALILDYASTMSSPSMFPAEF